MRDLTHLINWRRISDRITTSGQPSEAQLAELKELGVSHIINLGPHHNKGALDDEAKSVAALGMDYVYIPVKFGQPTEADFTAFCEAMAELEGKTLHVHCIYNARVSAFFYRYAKAGLGGSPDVAFQTMDSIWRPGSDWADFIGNPDAKSQMNRYAGEDY